MFNTAFESTLIAEIFFIQRKGIPNVTNTYVHRKCVSCTDTYRYVFRLDALALSVIATATWLAGWLAGWVAVRHSRYIVSKRLNLSENFLDHLVGPSFKHLGPLTPIPNSTGNPFIVGVKYTGGGWENWRLSTYIAVYLGNGAR